MHLLQQGSHAEPVSAGSRRQEPTQNAAHRTSISYVACFCITSLAAARLFFLASPSSGLPMSLLCDESYCAFRALAFEPYGWIVRVGWVLGLTCAKPRRSTRRLRRWLIAIPSLLWPRPLGCQGRRVHGWRLSAPKCVRQDGRRRRWCHVHRCCACRCHGRTL